MLYYTILCYATLCYTMLCHAMCHARADLRQRLIRLVEVDAAEDDARAVPRAQGLPASASERRFLAALFAEVLRRCAEIRTDV